MTNKFRQGEILGQGQEPPAQGETTEQGQDFPTMIKQKMDEMQQGGAIPADVADPDAKIDFVVNELQMDPTMVSPEMREDVKKLITDNTQNVGTTNQSPSISAQTGTMSTTQPVIGASDTRSLLIKLNNHYAKNGLDFMEALKVWKQEKLSPEAIRDQVRSDVKNKISLAEAKALYKTGSQMMLGYSDLGLESDIKIDENLLTKRAIKMTPSVKSSVERIGQNLFRTKNASILWKIDMKKMDDGQSVPYLVRVETVEATEEDARKK